MQPIPLNLVCVECEYDKSQNLLACEYCSRLMCSHFAFKVAEIISKWNGDEVAVLLRISCETDARTHGVLK